MMDWLRDNMWAAWLTIAAVLGLAELASLDFTLLMLAAGALTAAGVAAFFRGCSGCRSSSDWSPRPRCSPRSVR